jgi:hypothetical protein
MVLKAPLPYDIIWPLDVAQTFRPSTKLISKVNNNIGRHMDFFPIVKIL